MAKLWFATALLLLAGRSANAYSLYGPSNAEAFQVPLIGYNLPALAGGGYIVDVATPRNIGEQYRWNTPFLYYACDANFLNYFGATGAAEVDKAFAVFNTTVSNVSSYSSNLVEWPLNTRRSNFRADALLLLDVKSEIMQEVLEGLGAAQAERWVWCIHARAGGPCPTFTYNIIQRNYDPTTGVYSAYVNGTLYGYNVIEQCNVNPNLFAPMLADAVEYPVDPTATSFTTVGSQALSTGQFFTGLTRDDVASLRYMQTQTNVFVEPAGTNNLQIITNNSSLILVTTSNLAPLLSASLTNSGAQLQGLFPGLQVTSSIPLGFSNVVTATLGGFFVPDPFAPPGSPGQFVVTTTFTTNLVQVFSNTFGNIVVIATNNQSTISVQTGGVPSTFITNVPGGEFFFVPANQCGFSIISTNLAAVTTNITTTITVITNGTTNITTVGTVFTNHTLVVAVPTCLSNSVALRKGMDRIPTFFRQDFDSLLGTFWAPVTNTFSLIAVTNNSIQTNFFSRLITAPDITITAADLGAGLLTRTAPVFARANAGNGLGGPGIIQSAGTGVITLNKVGPYFLSPGSATIIANDFNQSQIANWGSFDGTTNAPVVYPDPSSLANLENQVFLQITVSGPLPIAQKNQFYTTTLTATGVEPPPYTWTLAANSPGLPTGLHLVSTNGVITGTPLASGIFDFTVQVQDDTGRASQRNFEIQVNP